MAPRANGSHLVPSEFVEAFNDLSDGGRERILKMWEDCECDKAGWIT